MVRVRALGKWSGLAWLVAVTLLVSGCSGAPASEAGSEYVEPAWMTQYRADFEETISNYSSCLIANGLTPVIAASGHVTSDLVIPNDTPPEQIEQLREQAIAQASNCAQYETVPVNGSNAEHEYERMIDTNTCLIAQGYPLETPPSQDVWIEKYLIPEAQKTGAEDYPYYPYQTLASLEGNGTVAALTTAQWGELQRSCPATSGQVHIFELE